MKEGGRLDFLSGSPYFFYSFFFFISKGPSQALLAQWTSTWLELKRSQMSASYPWNSFSVSLVSHLDVLKIFYSVGNYSFTDYPKKKPPRKPRAQVARLKFTQTNLAHKIIDIPGQDISQLWWCVLNKSAFGFFFFNLHSYNESIYLRLASYFRVKWEENVLFCISSYLKKFNIWQKHPM